MFRTTAELPKSPFHSFLIAFIVGLLLFFTGFVAGYMIAISSSRASL